MRDHRPQAERGRPRALRDATESGRALWPGAGHDFVERAQNEIDARGRCRAEPRPARHAGTRAARASPRRATPNDRVKPLRRAEEVSALPGQCLAERQEQQKRHDQRHECEVEKRRADGNLLARQRLERQRIERADEHRRAGGREEEVVEDESALARHRREHAALLAASARARRTAPASRR